jgi:hypothetical protein
MDRNGGKTHAAVDGIIRFTALCELRVEMAGFSA